MTFSGQRERGRGRGEARSKRERGENGEKAVLLPLSVNQQAGEQPPIMIGTVYSKPFRYSCLLTLDPAFYSLPLVRPLRIYV